jgi:hypothetical protein
MIWFACKQCGKRQERPDSAAGSLVFCECGQGNRVPWESTVEAPELPPEPAPSVPPRRPRSADYDEPERPRRPRWHEPTPRDPAYCLNHQEVPYEQVCADCGEHFCSACTVTFRGKTLCGPCKNFRVSGVHRPLRVSAMAILSLVLALVGCPLACCLSSAPVGALAQSTLLAVVLCAAGLVVPSTALLLGLLALRETDSNPRVGGRGLAIMGSATAVMGVVLGVTMLLVIAGRQFVN